MGIIAVAIAVAIFAIVIAGALRSRAPSLAENRGDGPDDVERQRFHEKAEHERIKPHVPAFMDEEEFQKRFNRAYGALIEDSFPSKIAGASHLNSDGSLRSSILAASSLLDPLDLVAEPDNQFDPKAIAVRRNDTGQQLGYLPERTAHDLLRQMDDSMGRWIGVLHKFNRDPNGEIVGANIIVAWIPIEKITVIPPE